MTIILFIDMKKNQLGEPYSVYGDLCHVDKLQEIGPKKSMDFLELNFIHVLKFYPEESTLFAMEAPTVNKIWRLVKHDIDDNCFVRIGSRDMRLLNTRTSDKGQLFFFGFDHLESAFDSLRRHCKDPMIAEQTVHVFVYAKLVKQRSTVALRDLYGETSFISYGDALRHHNLKPGHDYVFDLAIDISNDKLTHKISTIFNRTENTFVSPRTSMFGGDQMLMHLSKR